MPFGHWLEIRSKSRLHGGPVILAVSFELLRKSPHAVCVASYPAVLEPRTQSLEALSLGYMSRSGCGEYVDHAHLDLPNPMRMYSGLPRRRCCNLDQSVLMAALGARREISCQFLLRQFRGD